jgi:hypothetical protein
MHEQSSILKRYTNLASALDILAERRLVLLDPEKWDDKDDAYFMWEYRKRMNCDAVKALCFTTSGETYHHWRIYSHGNDGVCFEFFRGPLESAARQQITGIECEPVSYLSIDEIEQSPPPIEKWPFTKRRPYEGEGEFRIVCRCSNGVHAPSIEIKPDWIYRVKLSPWLHEALEPSVRTVLKELAKRDDMPVYRSRLIDYERWRRAVGVSLMV